MTGALFMLGSLFALALFATYRGATAAADWLDRKRG